MIKIYSVSLGCPKNRVDTERTLGSLGPSTVVATPEEADLVFINTCGFIAPAISESVRTLVDHIEKITACAPGKRPLLAVAGCLVGRFGTTSLAPDLPEVDLFLDVADLPFWGERIRERMGLGSMPASRLLSTGPSYAWLKISDGCRHACSFCTIPAIRGKLRSSAQEDLLREARQIVSSGVKELVLVAQDLTAYGSDRKEKYALQQLLEQLLPLQGLERLRLMYLYPAGVTRELLDFLAGAGAPFVPYFDVPLQHAAPGVLSRMGRPFAQNPHEVVDRIRSVFPDAALRTSLIVGFPGETTQDVDTLCEFVAATRFHHLGVFAYQPEEGTPAAAMPDQIADAEKQFRRDTLMELQGEISEEILAEYMGQRLKVLVDSAHDEWPGLHVGRAWFQAPESDGITYVSGKGVEPGALVEAEVVETNVYDLVALGEPDEGPTIS